MVHWKMGSCNHPSSPWECSHWRKFWAHSLWRKSPWEDLVDLPPLFLPSYPDTFARHRSDHLDFLPSLLSTLPDSLQLQRGWVSWEAYVYTGNIDLHFHIQDSRGDFKHMLVISNTWYLNTFKQICSKAWLTWKLLGRCLTMMINYLNQLGVKEKISKVDYYLYTCQTSTSSIKASDWSAAAARTMKYDNFTSDRWPFVNCQRKLYRSSKAYIVNGSNGTHLRQPWQGRLPLRQKYTCVDGLNLI